MIRPIDSWSVDQITSGQVVTSLPNAVKEIVENSLDAGATVVEIKVSNHGRDGFSVTDNGHGIDPEDFDFLALKHATSKLREFSDLSEVRTLGFRGEALASICALADVTIITNTSTGSSGYELEFDHEGRVKSKHSVASPKGTIVNVTNLFENLPVRRKTFERSSTREFTKTVELIQEYALLSSARITLEHSVKNRKSVTLRSQGSKLIQRIACIYGAKRTKSLQLVESSSSDGRWTVSGYISKPVFGMGDSSSACQLLAVNSRPVKQQRLQRAIVEVYKQYNLTEQPFFVFNVEMRPDMYDVNVTPDKRSLLLHEEDTLISEFREVIDQAFNDSDHSVPRSLQEVNFPPPKRQKQSRLSFAAFASSGSVIDQTPSETLEESPEPFPDVESEPVQDVVPEALGGSHGEQVADSPASEDSESDDSGSDSLDRTLVPGDSSTRTENVELEAELDTVVKSECLSPVRGGCCQNESSLESPQKRSVHSSKSASPQPPQPAPANLIASSYQQLKTSSRRLKTLNSHIHLPLSIDDVESACKRASESEDRTMKRLQTLAIDDEGVEERLQLSIRKDDFDKMEIVGQFNLGFILVVIRKANHDDLFVIDQHASDEIYNFERLQASTVLSRQPLVVPRTLELSAAEELTIQSHLSVFENNGFSINIKPENPPGKQCVLVSVPFSKSTIFDEKDVLELLGRLKEDPNQPNIKCSKLRAMFAMRACRSSIMIGKPLDFSTMQMVVRHMGTLNKPWNCPHGRPTLRHITTLS